MKAGKFPRNLLIYGLFSIDFLPELLDGKGFPEISVDLFRGKILRRTQSTALT